MWNVNGNSVQMTEGDFGIALPITVTGVEVQSGDYLSIQIKDKVNGKVLINRPVPYSELSLDTFNFVLTEEESAMLPVGTYVYVFDWYHEATFVCNIIPCGTFKVVEKA